MQYFKSKGGGQFFKVIGNRVVIVCTYGFNPSVEITTFDPKLIAALEAKPTDAEGFASAYAEVTAIVADFAGELAAAA